MDIDEIVDRFDEKFAKITTEMNGLKAKLQDCQIKYEHVASKMTSFEFSNQRRQTKVVSPMASVANSLGSSMMSPS